MCGDELHANLHLKKGVAWIYMETNGYREVRLNERKVFEAPIR